MSNPVRGLKKKKLSQTYSNRSSTINSANHITVTDFGNEQSAKAEIEKYWSQNRDLKQQQETINDVIRTEKKHYKTGTEQIMREALGAHEFERRKDELEQSIKNSRNQAEIDRLERRMKSMCDSSSQSVITTGSVKGMKFERSNWTHRKGPQATEDLEKSKRFEEESRQKVMLDAQLKFDREKRMNELDLKNQDGMSRISSMNAPSYTLEASTRVDSTRKGSTRQGSTRNNNESTYARTYTDTETNNSERCFRPEFPDGLRYAESTSCFSTIKDKIPKNTIPPFDRATETDMALYRSYRLTADDIRIRSVPPEVSSLPIFQKRDQIIREVENSIVTVIRGETGSGKTTQVPQFLLEQAAIENRKCNIVVTQPRKLATISVAKRVCRERGWDDFESSGGNSIVGYQVGLDKKIGEHTRLSFMTTGVLLRILISQKSFINYTHLIVDEVHERDMDTDMLLLCIKYLMRKGTTCRIILMSATMDINEYKQYFDMHFNNTKDGDQPSLEEFSNFESESMHLENDSAKQLEKSKKYVKSSVGEVTCSTEPFCTHLINLSTLLETNELKLENFPYQDSGSTTVHINYNRLANKAHALKTQLDIDERIMNPKHEDNKNITFHNDWDQPTEITLSEAAYDLAIHIIFELVHKFRQVAEEEARKRGKKINLNKEAILIFLPGIYEIRALDQKIRQKDLQLRDQNARSKNSYGKEVDYEHRCYPLHSSITLKDQQKIFKDVSVNKVKVILATNIAESSITVPDVRYVIDFCMTKQMVADKLTTYQCLKLQYASKAQMKQRKGRAGRTKPGVVFQLVTSSFKKNLPEYSIPDMRRCSLENTVLQIKGLQFPKSPKELFKMAITPPRLIDVERAIVRLKQLGGLTKSITPGKCIDYSDGHVTFLGRMMEVLPLDIKLTRLVFMGYCFGPINDCIIMAACMALQNFWPAPYDDYSRTASIRSMLRWDAGAQSDPIAMLNAFWAFMNLGETSVEDCKRWCLEHMLEYIKMKEVENLYHELLKRLNSLNINGQRLRIDGINTKEEHILLLKIVLSAAFYPNYLETEAIDLKTISNSLLHHDPYCSVSINLSHHKKLPSEALIRPLTKCLNNYGLTRRISFLHDKAIVEFQNIPHGRDDANNASTYPEENDFECKTQNIKVLLSDISSAKQKNKLQLDKPKLTKDEHSRTGGKDGTNKRWTLDSNNNEWGSGIEGTGDYFSCLDKLRKTQVNLTSNFKELKSVLEKVDFLGKPEFIGTKSGTYKETRKRPFKVFITKWSEYPTQYGAKFIDDPNQRDSGALSIHPTKFYGVLEYNLKNFEQIFELCKAVGQTISFPEKFRIGGVYLTVSDNIELVEDDAAKEGAYYRVSILRIKNGLTNTPKYDVLFIDYGWIQTVGQNNLFVLPDPLKNYPPMARPFRVSGIQIVPTCVKKSEKLMFTEFVNPTPDDIYSYTAADSYLNCILISTADDFYTDETLIDIIEETIDKKFHSQTKRFSEVLQQHRYAHYSAEAPHSMKTKFDLENGVHKRNDEVIDYAIDQDYLTQQQEKARLTRTNVETLMDQESIYVNWPKNPFKRTFKSLTQISCNKFVSIPRSINSVVLNHEVTGGQLLVAGRLEKAAYGDNIKAFNTTLFPDIPGLLSIVTAVFAPQVEMRVKRNHKKGGDTYYVSGLLAGMGLLDKDKAKNSDGVNNHVSSNSNIFESQQKSNNKSITIYKDGNLTKCIDNKNRKIKDMPKSFFPEDDLEINSNSLYFEPQDICKANNIRYYINRLARGTDKSHAQTEDFGSFMTNEQIDRQRRNLVLHGMVDSKRLSEFQGKIRNEILSLIRVQRKRFKDADDDVSLPYKWTPMESVGENQLAHCSVNIPDGVRKVKLKIDQFPWVEDGMEESARMYSYHDVLEPKNFKDNF